MSQIPGSAGTATSTHPPLPHQGHIIRHFTPNWFAATMGTGILSVALAQLSSHPALFALGDGLWRLNILLFLLCSVLYAARWILYPHEAVRIFAHPVASMFLGCIAMGLATIVNGFLIFGPAHLGASAINVAKALWWVDVILSLLCGLAIPFVMFTVQSHAVERMTGVWLLPIVASEVASASGALLMPHLDGAQAQLAVLTVSYALWACSVPLALGILVVLFLRMVLHNLPEAGMAASCWLALGPLGTGALSLFIMSQNAPAVLEANGLGSLASAVGGASLIGGLILWGYGLWWMAMAVMITISYARKGIPYNIGWWGYTFPLGVFAVATAKLSTILPLPPLSDFAEGLIAALSVVWLVVALRSLRGIADRSLFIAPCLIREE